MKGIRRFFTPTKGHVVQLKFANFFDTLYSKRDFFCIGCIARHGGVWWESSIDPHILNTITIWKWLLCPGRYTPGETAHATHWIAGWMGIRAGLDALEKVKISSFSWKSKLNYPVCDVIAWFLYRLSFHLMLYRYELGLYLGMHPTRNAVAMCMCMGLSVFVHDQQVQHAFWSTGISVFVHDQWV